LPVFTLTTEPVPASIVEPLIDVSQKSYSSPVEVSTTVRWPSEPFSGCAPAGTVIVCPPMLTPLAPLHEPEPSAFVQTMCIVGSDGLAKNTARLPAPTVNPPPGRPTDQSYVVMCETNAALSVASAGAAGSVVLNGAPVNGCQHAGCEPELICDSGHEAAASATVGMTSAPATASATATSSAADMAIGRARSRGGGSSNIGVGTRCEATPSDEDHTTTTVQIATVTTGSHTRHTFSSRGAGSLSDPSPR
jgi:hypothetical protein